MVFTTRVTRLYNFHWNYFSIFHDEFLLRFLNIPNTLMEETVAEDHFEVFLLNSANFEKNWSIRKFIHLF